MDLVITGRIADTQASHLYKVLEGQIVSGQLLPGQELSERSISEQLKIGRTPVREALQKLAANHLVRIEPRRGTSVSPVTVAGTTELFSIVWSLERLMMQRACERGSAAELHRVCELAPLSAAETRSNLPYVDVYGRIAQAARNPYLASVLAPMRVLVERIRIISGLAQDPELCRTFSELVRRVAERDRGGVNAAFDTYAGLFQDKSIAVLTERERSRTASPSLPRPHAPVME
jgi:DNA-binding GntR family transcriptional regulator